MMRNLARRFGWTAVLTGSVIILCIALYLVLKHAYTI